MKQNQKQSTSWQPVQKWYRDTVGDEGHYYHQKIVLPGVLRLAKLSACEDPSLLDLACGQGVLARHLPKQVEYCGIDISPALIKAAREAQKGGNSEFLVGDATKPLKTTKQNFSHAAIILALQNIEHPQLALQNASKHLRTGGTLILVLNHPCFRIPRQSSWEIDESKKLQYRRIERYMLPMNIPIQAHPSKGHSSPTTWTFHHPLSAYTQWLAEAGFVIEALEEWCSDKVSTGKNAKMENSSRDEFPLFMAISARKK